jgi:pilus assembly protein CpaF
VFAVVISEKGGAERREVFEGTEVSVGRVRGNDLVLSKGNVSKRHARLTQKDGRFVVVDQNSTNGTYVNRQRIVQATIVREGDRIYIGDFVLRIEEAGGVQTNSEEGAPNRSDRSEGETVEHTSWQGPSPDELKSPQLPPAPRLPAPLSRAPRREASESDVPRVSKTEASVPKDVAAVDAVRLLVDRVTEKVERRTLERDIADNVARKIERVLLEELGRMRDEKVLSTQLTEEQLLVAARAELVGLGPLEALIRNPHATQLTANGTKSVSIVQGARLNYSSLPFSSADSLERVLARLCRMSEASHDGRETFMSGRLQGGVMWKAVRQRAAPDGIVLTLRRRTSVESSLDELVRDGVVSRAIATFLTHCMGVRANILVLGSRAASVARVLSALSDAAAERQLLILDEYFQLAASASTAIRLDLATAALDQSRLVDFAAGLPETSLVVERLEGRTLAAVMEAIVRGSSGVLGGVHCNNVEQGLTRLSTGYAASIPGVSVDAARQNLVSSFDLVLEVGVYSDGRERVRRIVEPVCSPSGITQLQEIFAFFAERTAAGGSVEGSFLASGTEPKLLDELRSRGLHIEASLFHRASPS